MMMRANMSFQRTPDGAAEFGRHALLQIGET